MNLIMISTDRSAFNDHSPFFARLQKYGKLFDALHVIVFTDVNYAPSSIGANVNLWPTRSRFKILAPVHAYFIAERLARGHAKDFVVSSQEEFGALAALCLKWKLGVPWQAQIHSDPFSPYFSQFSLKNKIRVLLLKILLPYASAVRVVSQRIRQNLEARRITKKSIEVLPIFTPAKGFVERDYQDPPFDFVFLMVSRLTAEKNIEMAIHAIARLLTAHPQTTLRIVGDGPERGRLENVAEGLRLGAHVQFMGWRQELKDYYESSDAFLLTSWYEGYGLGVIEAMSFGLPIVMTDVGVAGDLLCNNESGLVVSPGNEDQLYDAIIKVRSNEYLRATLGRKARSVTTTFLPEGAYLRAFQESINTCKL